MKTKHQKPIQLKLFQSAVSYLMLLGLLLTGLPISSMAQKPEKNEDLAAGRKITLRQSMSKNSSKMSAQSFSAMKTQAVQNKSNLAKTAGADGEVEYAVLNVEFKTVPARQAVFTETRVSKIKDAYILTTFDKFADVFVSTDAAWEALLNNPNVLRVEYDTSVKAPPPPPVEASKLISQAVPENIVRGGYKGLTGKNVIIAVLDTGIDFRHPDFITYDPQNRPTSRIKYLWDTATDFQKGRGSTAPVKYPNGTSIGTLYTKDQLSAELRSSKMNIPATDLDGHGTACASVAAGNGNADKQEKGLKRKEVEGVAPEAEIIGVRLGYDGLENSYLLNAIVEWLEKEAKATPLVISGSFGGHYTGHDGQTITERQLNARFPLNKPGRAIVFAAGNEGNDAIHAKVNFAKEAKLVAWDAKEDTQMRIYFDSNDDKTVLSATKLTPLGDNLRVELNPITKQYSASFPVKAGVGGIWVENLAGRAGEAHLYFYDRSLGVFSPDNVSYGNLVGTPGSMENAITVGSYDWNDNFNLGGKLINLTAVCRNSDGARMPFEIGFLSCYSSPGPNRNGTVKPDIVSPGEWYSSANAKNNGETVAWGQPDTTGNYRQMNGTSAATPYTSGIVALMFQKKPTLMLGEVKNLLKGKASKSGLNPFKDAIPNKNWGYGKLDMTAIDSIFASL